MKYFLVFLLSLSLTIGLQAQQDSYETVERYLNAVKEQRFDDARKFFSPSQTSPSKSEIQHFADVLKRISTSKIQVTQEVKGLSSFPFRGQQINLEYNDKGFWVFTELTRDSIAELYAESQVYNTPEKTIQYFQDNCQKGDFRTARSAFSTLIDKDKNALFQQELTERHLLYFQEILKEIESQKLAQRKSSTIVYYELVQDDKSSRIFLHRNESGDWHFTPNTGRSIAKIHAKAVDNRLRSWIPANLTSKFILFQNWKWLGMLIIIFIGVVAQWSLQKILQKTVIKKIGKVESYSNNKKAYRSISILTMALSWYFLIPVLGLPEAVSLKISTGASLVALIATLFVLSQAINIGRDFFVKKASETENKIDDALIPMGHKVLKILLFVVGSLFIAGNLNIDVTSLLAGLGIGGLAFALAAKDTVENIFGSVTVLLDKPFEIGDWVVVDGVEGTVEQIGLRSTRIRTFYCSQVNVPNSTLISATVDNFGRRSYRRIKTMLGLTYDTPPEKIEAFCEGVRELIRQHPHTRKDYYHVYLNQFNGSSLDILLYCFIDCDDWAIELREKQRLFLDIIRLAARLNVQFAYPTQTLHMAKDSHQYDSVTENNLDDISAAILSGRQTGLNVSHDTLPSDTSQIPSNIDYAKGNGYLNN